jgi:transcriptional regulator with XRE-family HTH domain
MLQSRQRLFRYLFSATRRDMSGLLGGEEGAGMGMAVEAQVGFENKSEVITVVAPSFFVAFADDGEFAAFEVDVAEYVRRVRTGLKMSQRSLAAAARMHVQSLGKIEKGETRRLSGKTKAGLARVLGVSADVLDAVCRGVPVVEVRGLKICPRCWVPGSDAEAMWLEGRAKRVFFVWVRVAVLLQPVWEAY